MKRLTIRMTEHPRRNAYGQRFSELSLFLLEGWRGRMNLIATFAVPKGLSGSVPEYYLHKDPDSGTRERRNELVNHCLRLAHVKFSLGIER